MRKTAKRKEAETKARQDVKGNEEAACEHPSLTSLTPWLEAGMSRASWFRHQRAERSTHPLVPKAVTLVLALMKGDHTTADRVYRRMVETDISTIPPADRHVVNAALQAALGLLPVRRRNHKHDR